MTTPTAIACGSEHIPSKSGVFLDVLLGDGAIGKVWGGWMIVEGESISRRRVAMKISITSEGRDHLLREEKVYKYLGPAAPRYYGVFEDGNGTTALLLDFLGTTVADFEEGSCPRLVFTCRMFLVLPDV
jgi:hypothetical protein